MIKIEIPPETHPNRYWIHKFWARKPTNVVRAYLEHYTKTGDIILDPFCGSGVIPVEAFFLGRKAIGIDLNPFATFLTSMTAIPCNLEKLNKAFSKIESKAKEKIYPLYETQCPNCEGKAHIISTIWVDSRTPTHVFIECSDCQDKREGRQLIRVREQDIISLTKAEMTATTQLEKFSYPVDKLPHDADAETVNQLFSKRNLYALCVLNDLISKYSKGVVRDLLKLTFTANLEPVSKLVPLRRSRFERGVVPAGSWYDKRFRISKDRVEGNVWYYFKNRFQKTFRAKKETNDILVDSKIDYNEASSFSELLDDKNILITTQSATDLGAGSAQIPDNSVDYIFTDPPYAGAVPYFGLSTMWASWLGFEMDYVNEITINKRSGKTKDQYRKDLIRVFQEMYRVLKKDGFCTLWFHYKDPDIWFALLHAAEYAGFERVALVPQRPAKTSGTMGGNPETAITGDFVVTFKRLPKPRLDLYINGYGFVVDIEKLIIEETAQLLVGKVEGLRYDTIYDNLIKIMVNRGLYHSIDPQKISKDKILKIIRTNFRSEIVNKVTHWYFDEKNEKLTALVREEELIKHYLSSIVNSFGSKGATISQIHKKLIPLLPKLETTDPEMHAMKLLKLLKEIGAHVKFPNMWTLAPKYKREGRRKPVHNEVIYMLYEIGKRCNYEIYIGKAEQGRRVKGQRLGDLDIHNDLPASLAKRLSANDRSFIEQIDILWFKDSEIHAFEIEFSTGITFGAQRICNLIRAIPDWAVSGYVVILEKRKLEKETIKKLGDRTFRKLVRNKKLFYILTPSLVQIFKALQKSPSLEVNIQGTIMNIVKSPTGTTTLQEYPK